MEWQPIETLTSRDRVALFHPRIWDERRKEYSHGFWIKVDHYQPDAPRQPTHWMPLPDPPKEKS